MEQNVSCKEMFKIEILKKYKISGKYYIAEEEYQQIVKDLKASLENKSTKSAHEYYILRKFEIIDTLTGEKLIKKRKSKEDDPVYYVTIEEMYEIIERAHLATNHGGRCRMNLHLGGKYANITREALEIFKSNCEPCQTKAEKYIESAIARSNELTEISSLHDLIQSYCIGKRKNKPCLTAEVLCKIKDKDICRGYLFLIDAQLYGDSNYKWILVYRDKSTKFCVLRTISCMLVSEVAFELFDIFHLFGTPTILYSDLNDKFFVEVIDELKILWPGLILVRGIAPDQSIVDLKQSLNHDIKKKLDKWMSDRKSDVWIIGLRFVQSEMNSVFNPEIDCSPYTAMFGSSCRYFDISSSGLPDKVTSILETEDDILTIINILSKCANQSQIDPSSKERESLSEVSDFDGKVINSGSTNTGNDSQNHCETSRKRRMFLESVLKNSIKKQKKSVQSIAEFSKSKSIDDTTSNSINNILEINHAT